MLNDEDDSVRMEAIKTITEVMKDVTLKESELNAILFNLRENILELRIVLYKLIGIIDFEYVVPL